MLVTLFSWSLWYFEWTGLVWLLVLLLHFHIRAAASLPLALAAGSTLMLLLPLALSLVATVAFPLSRLPSSPRTALGLLLAAAGAAAMLPSRVGSVKEALVLIAALRHAVLAVARLPRLAAILVGVKGEGGKKMKRMASRRSAFLVLVGLAALMAMLAQLALAEQEGHVYEEARTRGEPTRQPESSAQMHGACRATFGGDLKLLDFALMAELSYSVDVTSGLATWFRGEYEVRHFENSTAAFYDFYSPADNTSVIAIRGSDGPRDMTEDLLLYGEILAYQLPPLRPFFWTMRAHELANLAHASEAVENWVMGTAERPGEYQQAIEDYVASIVDQRRNVYLTGHSLGACLAKIVGIRLGLESIGFAPAGVMYMATKMDLDYETLHRTVTNVIAEHDPIQFADDMGGTIHWLPCHGNEQSCHWMPNYACQLAKSCGDVHGRYSKYCDAEFKPQV